jgi:hypothetical protein
MAQMVECLYSKVKTEFKFEYQHIEFNIIFSGFLFPY